MHIKKLITGLVAAFTLSLAATQAYAADAKPAGTIIGVTSTKSPAALVYVDVQTGTKHELLPGDAAGPCFSPDGQNIAFVYKDMIYIVPRSNIEARRELVPTKGAYAKHLSWTDNGYIYFGEGKSIFRVSVSGKGTKEEVAKMPSQLNRKTDSFGYLNVSNDGKRAAWWGKSIEAPPPYSWVILASNGPLDPVI